MRDVQVGSSFWCSSFLHAFRIRATSGYFTRSRDVRNGVVSGEFDLGLAADEVDVSGLVHQPFVSPRALCAIPLGHPLAERSLVTPHDLAGLDFVAYVPEDRARQRLDLAIAEAGAAPPRIVVETIYAATAGFDQSRIVLRPFEPAVHSKSVLLLPADRPKSQLVRDFIDCLMAER